MFHGGLRPEPPQATSDVTGGPFNAHEAGRYNSARSLVVVGVLMQGGPWCRLCADRLGPVAMTRLWGPRLGYLWQHGRVGGIMFPSVVVRCVRCGEEFRHEV